MAFSMSLASPMLRSLWLACCVSSALRGLTYHRHKYGGWVPSEATRVGKLKAGGVRCAQWLLPRETSRSLGTMRNYDVGGAFVCQRSDQSRGLLMRVMRVCAIIITTAVGLAGCFHHQQATYAEPIARPPLK